MNEEIGVDIEIDTEQQEIPIEVKSDVLKGDKGDKGDPTATIEINQVITGEPGTSVIVENVGTDVNMKLNITIPRGYKGETPSKGIDYYTEVEKQELINEILSQVNQFSVEVVSTLPTEGIKETTIYFVPKENSKQKDVYDEYIFINNDWEHIGTTEIDLSNYYDKAEVDNKINNLSTNYKSNTITAPTCEGFGKIKKLYGKTEETGEGEKSPDNPYEISCVGDSGQVEIISTDGTNTSNKVITCKPLCCLKDSEGNIIAQDYIDFTKGKIHRECGYAIFNGTEEWAKSSATDFDRFVLYTSYDILDNCKSTSNLYKTNSGADWSANEYMLDNHQNGHRVIITAGAYGNLTLEQFKANLATNNLIIVFEKGTQIEEDINTTNSIVQYADETTISNSDNAEMEVELTKNKAISSINENIGALQEEDNKVKEILSADWITPQMLNDWKNASGLFNSCQYKKIGNVVYIRGSITKNRTISSNEDRIVFYLQESYRPKKNYVGTINGHPYNIQSDGMVAIGNSNEFKANDWCCFDGLIIFTD